MRAYLDFLSLVVLLCYVHKGLSQTTVSLIPTHDNTMFEEDGNESMGMSGYIFAGKTGSLNNGNSRRALLKFDFSSIPSNAVISEVSLDLAIFLAPNNNTHSMNLHRVFANWGEGNSGIDVSRGEGEDAETNDATWSHRFYNTPDTWSQQGGDFQSRASAISQVQFVNSPQIPHAIWNSAGLVTDVQEWVDGTISNFGWILIGDESTAKSAKKFVGKDNTSIFFPKPKLTITYSLPGALVLKSPFLNEVNLHDDWIEIYNGTDESFDLSSWSLCEGTTCNTINSIDAPIIHGDANLDTSEFLILRWPLLDTMSGEIVLQSSVGSLDTAEMKDYLQYGTANQLNAAAAVIKSFWNDANSSLSIPTNYKSTLSLTSDSDFTSGQKTNATNWNTWGATASLVNNQTQANMMLIGQLVGGSYIATDQITINGQVPLSQVVELEAPNGIYLNSGMTVDSAAVLQAIILE
ncbi:MAG: hypothetical protein ACI9FN_001111 [Saprospiraceae bacterium]|jgi:hypothetical protein